MASYADDWLLIKGSRTGNIYSANFVLCINPIVFQLACCCWVLSYWSWPSQSTKQAPVNGPSVSQPLRSDRRYQRQLDGLRRKLGKSAFQTTGGHWNERSKHSPSFYFFYLRCSAGDLHWIVTFWKLLWCDSTKKKGSNWYHMACWWQQNPILCSFFPLRLYLKLQKKIYIYNKKKKPQKKKNISSSRETELSDLPLLAFLSLWVQDMRTKFWGHSVKTFCITPASPPTFLLIVSPI